MTTKERLAEIAKGAASSEDVPYLLRLIDRYFKALIRLESHDWELPEDVCRIAREALKEDV